MEVTIRPYQAGEEEAIWQVVYRATRVSNARDYHPTLIERWAPDDRDLDEWRDRLRSTDPFVAVAGDQIAGMAEVDSSGMIDFFYVAPEYQGEGVGKELLAAIEKKALGSGAAELRAHVSVTARPFFLACGFAVEKAQENLVLGLPAPNFVMRKSLERT